MWSGVFASPVLTALPHYRGAAVSRMPCGPDTTVGSAPSQYARERARPLLDRPSTGEQRGRPLHAEVGTTRWCQRNANGACEPKRKLFGGALHEVHEQPTRAAPIHEGDQSRA